MENSKKPVANPSVVLREEFDDWAVLFDPDTNDGFGLSPTGVYLWKLLDGERSIDEMVTALRRDATDVPEEAGEQILAFVEELAQCGLAAYDAEQFQDGRERRLPLPTGIAENLPDGGREAGQLGSGMLRYERPRLVLLTLEACAQGADCSSGPSAGHSGTGFCHTGTGAGADGPWSCYTFGISAIGGVNKCCQNGTSAGASGASYGCSPYGYGATGGYTAWCSTGSNGRTCTTGANA